RHPSRLNPTNLVPTPTFRPITQVANTSGLHSRIRRGSATAAYTSSAGAATTTLSSITHSRSMGGILPLHDHLVIGSGGARSPPFGGRAPLDGWSVLSRAGPAHGKVGVVLKARQTEGGGAVVGGGRQRPGGRPESVGGVRVALGLISGVVAIALVAVLVDRFVLGAEWWQVRHTVTAEPVTPQREVGPPPGPLTVSWERTTHIHHGSVAGYDGVAYAVGLGQVVTASGRGLEVRDARTGAERWSYRRSGWTLLGWASTRSRLLGYFERDGDRGARLVIAFDALSGGLLWRREGLRPAAVPRATLRWPAGSGVLLATDDDRRTLIGVSAATGNRVWRLPLPKRCRLFEGGARPSAGREDLVALALDCGGEERHSRLLAVEPGAGEVAWERRLGSAESPEVSMLDGVTLVSDGTALRAFDEDGEQFGVWRGDDVCGDAMCPGVLLQGRLLVVYHPDGAKRGETRMEAVRVPSGKVEWGREVPAYAALAQAGGRVFALRPRLSGRLLPAGVDIVDPADGDATTAPAPLSVNLDLPGPQPWL